MYVIDVIPLSRTAPGTLSYRSKVELPVGSVVDIMLRKTSTQGIVISCLHVADAKEMLKHARFLLSKSAPSASGTIPESVITAAQKTAQYHATSIGAVLSTVFSEYVRAGVALPLSHYDSLGREFAVIECEADVPGRAKTYEDVLRANTQKDQATLLVVPTLAEALFWKETFSVYKPLMLTGALTGAARAKALERAITATGLVIATPTFSWTPITSLGSIIVDRISAGTYTTPKRPYLNMVRAITQLCSARSIPLIYGDYPLPLEFRADTQAPIEGAFQLVTLLDVRRDPDDQNTVDEPWRAVPLEVVTRIAAHVEAGGRAVLLTARAGYSPSVICRDCGQALTDERGLPYTFTTHGGVRLFKTADGKSTMDTKMKCPRCESWNLFPLGVGQERVLEEMKKELPDAHFVSVTSDMLKSPSQARKMLLEIEKPGTIVIGTEALLPWLLLDSLKGTPKPLGVIVSADSLLSLPFWRARERFVRLSYFFTSVCDSLTLVTRRAEDAAVDAVISPSTTTFFKEESDLRRAVGYPPFGTLITLCMEASTAALESFASRILEEFAPYAPTALVPQLVQGTTYKQTIVITLRGAAWPDPELSGKLQALGPGVRVRIDPESLL